MVKMILACVLMAPIFHGFSDQWDGSSTSSGFIYREDNISVNNLSLGKYGSSLAGDSDPFKINSNSSSGDRDLIIYGNSTAILNLRLYDGSLKIGKNSSPNASISNNGTITGTHLVSESNGWAKVDVKAKGSTDSLLRLYNDSDYWAIHNDHSDSNELDIRYNNITKLTVDSLGVMSVNKVVANDIEANGTITTKKVIVTQQNWPDYVFKKDYNLPRLEDVAKHIEEKQHLPEVPSAKEAESEGVSIGDMQKVLLKKIEELTLYTIQQQKEIESMRDEICVLRRKR